MGRQQGKHAVAPRPIHYNPLTNSKARANEAGWMQPKICCAAAGLWAGSLEGSRQRVMSLTGHTLLGCWKSSASTRRLPGTECFDSVVDSVVGLYSVVGTSILKFRGEIFKCRQNFCATFWSLFAFHRPHLSDLSRLCCRNLEH